MAMAVSMTILAGFALLALWELASWVGRGIPE